LSKTSRGYYQINLKIFRLSTNPKANLVLQLSKKRTSAGLIKWRKGPKRKKVDGAGKIQIKVRATAKTGKATKGDRATLTKKPIREVIIDKRTILPKKAIPTKEEITISDAKEIKTGKTSKKEITVNGRIITNDGIIINDAMVTRTGAAAKEGIIIHAGIIIPGRRIREVTKNLKVISSIKSYFK